MHQNVSCPHCSATVTVPVGAGVQTYVCGQCQQQFSVDFGQFAQQAQQQAYQQAQQQQAYQQQLAYQQQQQARQQQSAYEQQQAALQQHAQQQRLQQQQLLQQQQAAAQQQALQQQQAAAQQQALQQQQLQQQRMQQQAQAANNLELLPDEDEVKRAAKKSDLDPDEQIAEAVTEDGLYKEKIVVRDQSPDGQNIGSAKDNPPSVAGDAMRAFEVLVAYLDRFHLVSFTCVMVAVMALTLLSKILAGGKPAPGAASGLSFLTGLFVSFGLPILMTMPYICSLPLASRALSGNKPRIVDLGLLFKKFPQLALYSVLFIFGSGIVNSIALAIGFGATLVTIGMLSAILGPGGIAFGVSVVSMPILIGTPAIYLQSAIFNRWLCEIIMSEESNIFKCFVNSWKKNASVLHHRVGRFNVAIFFGVYLSVTFVLWLIYTFTGKIYVPAPGSISGYLPLIIWVLGSPYLAIVHMRAAYSLSDFEVTL